MKYAVPHSIALGPIETSSILYYFLFIVGRPLGSASSTSMFDIIASLRRTVLFHTLAWPFDAKLSVVTLHVETATSPRHV